MRSLKSKLLVLSLVSIAPAVLVASLVAIKLTGLARAMDVGDVYREAIRNFMQLDMMHDAIRSDVNQIANARSPGDIEEGRLALAQHTGKLRAMYALVAAAPLQAAHHALVKADAENVETYLQAASTTVAAFAVGDDAGLAPLTAFNAAFRTLEAANETISEALAEVDSGNLAAGARSTGWIAIAASLLGLAATLVFARRMGLRIVTRLADVSQTLTRVASGDFTSRIEVSDDIEEFGAMARDLNGAVDKLAADFAQLRAFGGQVAVAAAEVRSLAGAMAADASASTQHANAVASSSEQVSQNVNAVAVATEEMSATIQQIAQSAAEAARVATSAVDIAHSTNSTVTRLGDSSVEIHGVVKLISAIADQTHLLALNASIEAARAGDAGRGFAVVAGEVKELAGQTTRATKEIAKKIGTIQADIRDAVSAITRVGDVVGNINELQQTIASAVEEQAATTGEMGRNVSIAAAATEEIARGSGTAVTLAGGVTTSAEQSHQAAARLVHVSSSLEAVLGHYRVEHPTAQPAIEPTPAVVRPPGRPTLALVTSSSSSPKSPTASAKAA